MGVHVTAVAREIHLLPLLPHTVTIAAIAMGVCLVSWEDELCLK